MITKSSGHFLNGNSNNIFHKPHEADKKGWTRSRKRTHLTAAQIASLQASFANNPLPDAAIRHALSLSLGMTERTVQIWFQNRRAKARKVDGQSGASDGKSSLGGLGGLGGTCTPPPAASTLGPRYQATFRSMMTPQLFEEMNATNIGTTAGQTPLSVLAPSSQRRPRSASKPEKPKPTQVTLAPRARSEEINHLQDLTMSQSIPTVPLPVQMLRIGTWTRFADTVPTTDDMTAPSSWDLHCYCTNNQLIWQIQVQGQQFRIQIPVSAIHQLSFGPVEDDVTASFAQLKIQLDPHQLMFTMRLDNHQQWVRCGDFSEQKQASQLFIHEIQGYHNVLQQAVLNMLTIVPELAAKFVLVPSPSLDDLCRDLTMSPSATPEPSMIHGSTMYSSPLAAGLDKSMMIQAPFYMGSLATPYQAGSSHWY